jgi:hypothetical protein
MMPHAPVVKMGRKSGKQKGKKVNPNEAPCGSCRRYENVENRKTWFPTFSQRLGKLELPKTQLPVSHSSHRDYLGHFLFFEVEKTTAQPPW